MSDEEEERRIIADRERRQSNYEQIGLGKKIGGWKLTRLADESLDVNARYRVLLPRWPHANSFDKSVLVFIHQEGYSNNLRHYVRRFIIRRYSLIAAGVYTDIVRIYDGGFGDAWELNTNRDAQYISENILAIGWKRDGVDEIRIRLMLIDVRSKSYQIVETTGPQRTAYIRSFIKGPSYDRLSVLFQVDDDDHNSFYLSDYEITPSDNFQSPNIRQVASRRLDWIQSDWRRRESACPWGREMWHFDLALSQKFCFPGVNCGMFRYDLHGNLLASRDISFDHYRIRDCGDINGFLQIIECTVLCVRMAKAEKSLENLMPTDFSPDFLLHRSHLFAGGDRKPYILHRPLSPPSLLYCAAEAFCLANPNFDFARLKDGIGSDVFDGIYDGLPPIEIHM